MDEKFLSLEQIDDLVVAANEGTTFEVDSTLSDLSKVLLDACPIELDKDSLVEILSRVEGPNLIVEQDANPSNLDPSDLSIEDMKNKIIKSIFILSEQSQQMNQLLMSVTSELIQLCNLVENGDTENG
jgi:hypothetical protein